MKDRTEFRAEVDIPPMSRDDAATHPRNNTAGAVNLKASLLASRVMDPPTRNLMAGAAMTEPATSAAGGIALWKLLGGILGIGVVTSALGFMVLLPKTPREALVRAIATMAGSALLGPLVVAAAYSKWPEVFSSGATLAQNIGMEPWLGMFMVAAPLLAMAGLPFWWLLGAGVLWLERRKGKDLGELWQDGKAVL